MYIKGVGMTKFGIEDRSTADMMYEASHEALENANMSVDNINAVVVSTTDGIINNEKQRHAQSILSSLFRKKIPIIRVPAVCGGGGAAFWSALRLKYNNILVVSGDRILSGTSERITDQILQAAERVWEQYEGFLFPVQNALIAQQHMLRYGTTEKDLSLVAYKNHLNASKNPKARFYKKVLSLKQIQKSPVVASPFRLMDCSVSVNGAASVIISKEKTDIKVVGSGLNTDYLPTFEREDPTTFKACKLAGETAYKQAGITPKDIDVAELHDAFTILELMAYEDLGFCKKGEGKNMIRKGKTFLDGEIPVNTSGGLKAKGHPISPTGIAQIVEIVEQLQGKSGKRQVNNAKIGLAQNTGGAGGTVSVHILKNIAKYGET